jgi:4'-phosphopantetheinyl transferase
LAELEALTADDLHVWFAAVADGDDADWLGAESILSSDEQVRAARFRHGADRRLFLAAHVLQRSVLSKYAAVTPGAWRFATDPGGKPRILDPGSHQWLRFNLSHTRGWVALAVARDHEVGIDVERLPSSVDRDLPIAALSEPEREWIESHSANRVEGFYEIWTLKEAFLKASGHGLVLPLQEFSIRLEGESSAAVEFQRDRRAASPAIEGNATDWQFHRCRLGVDCALGIAVWRPRSSPMRVTLREFVRDLA